MNCNMNYNCVEDSSLKIFNDFGITPTTNYVAAGLDFYIPYLDTIDKVNRWIEAISQNKQKFPKDYLENVFNKLNDKLSNAEDKNVNKIILWNIVQLYISLDSGYLELFNDLDTKICEFIHEYLVFDKSGKPGIALKPLDHTLFNSGIKVALPHNTAGIFFNKSGKGTKGFSVRAQVVDEDYSGYVHLSNAYTKENDNDGIIYVGDKITQMVIVPIVLVNKCNELSKEEYDKIMSSSQRGDKAMGSSDVKH